MRMSDWSSDVCSSDLAGAKAPPRSTCKTLQNDLVMMYCLHNGTDELVMAGERAVYMGPRLRRLRRDLGLTQADMAGDLDISPSYIALLERNQRPLTADMLLRLARTYRIDMADLAGDGATEYAARLQAALRDPMFTDLDPNGRATSELQSL